MSLLGVHLTLLVGPTVAVPAPPPLTENLESITVTNSDSGRSGFQITFKAGRSGLVGVLDDPLLSLPLLRPFNRVILIVTFTVRARVLMDGVITNLEYNPGTEPGTSTVTATGEDVSLTMDQKERISAHPAQPAPAIVTKLILKYARFGLVPKVIKPKAVESPSPTERIPMQYGTDLSYIERLAEQSGHVFYISPGPTPYANQAYWGPPRRTDFPQRALSVNFGAQSNISSLSFRYDGLAPTFVEGKVQDKRTNIKLPVRTFASTQVPLASQPAWMVHMTDVRKTLVRGESASSVSAMARAQATTDASNEQVVTATGELDALRYGDVLRAHGLVGLRGAGYSYDGLYYVKQVTHTIRGGEYKQSFTLTREGVGATLPVLPS
jgi:hypothetical protein